MRICVDIDGTLSREPDNIRDLMKQLNHGRNRVVVLTGCLFDQPSQEERVAQLEELGVRKGEHYHELVRVPGFNINDVAHGKATYCRDNSVDMIFEDSDVYINMINLIAPRTTCFLIRRFSDGFNEAMSNVVAGKKKKGESVK